jgi:AcrR family transcriptional regulator
MGDVADAAGVTRRTLYRHFGSKEELAFEVTCLILEGWNSRLDRIRKGLSGSGIEMLRDLLLKAARHLARHSAIMEYMGEFDFHFRDSSTYRPPEALAAAYEDLIHHSDGLFIEVVEAGIEDGSIEGDIDVRLTVFAITNILWGYGQRLSARRAQLRREFGMDPLRLVLHQIDLYIRALERRGRARPARKRG